MDMSQQIFGMSPIHIKACENGTGAMGRGDKRFRVCGSPR